MNNKTKPIVVVALAAAVVAGAVYYFDAYSRGKKIDESGMDRIEKLIKESLGLVDEDGMDKIELSIENSLTSPTPARAPAATPTVTRTPTYAPTPVSANGMDRIEDAIRASLPE